MSRRHCRRLRSGREPMPLFSKDCCRACPATKLALAWRCSSSGWRLASAGFPGSLSRNRRPHFTARTQHGFRAALQRNPPLVQIGFNLSMGRLDNSYYDLLASEASLTSFLAISRRGTPATLVSTGQAQLLGRRVARVGVVGRHHVEYLMPRLFLEVIRRLSSAKRVRTSSVVRFNIAEQHGVPWGISESGYSLTDVQQNYQYMSFGVPGLGLKRGLEQDLVIAPYATLMAVMEDPHEAVVNFTAIANAGGEGPWGFYEAIDFTPRARYRRVERTSLFAATWRPSRAWASWRWPTVCSAIRLSADCTSSQWSAPRNFSYKKRFPGSAHPRTRERLDDRQRSPRKGPSPSAAALTPRSRACPARISYPTVSTRSSLQTPAQAVVCIRNLDVTRCAKMPHSILGANSFTSAI